MLSKLHVLLRKFQHALSFVSTRDDSTILDPLTCVFRLAMISREPDGTKLRVENNRIIFQKPERLQGFIRSLAGDTRRHLQNLLHPIAKAVEWYRDIVDVEVWALAIAGVEKLGKAYPTHSLVHHTLTYYKETLDGSRQHNLNSPPYTSSLHDHMRNLWSRDEIKVTTRLLTRLQTSAYRSALQSIVKGKEAELQDLLKNVVTRFD